MRAPIAAALLFGAVACSNAPAGSGSAEQSYRRGLVALAEGEPRTARIEFLNAIELDPANARFRFAQARTYLLLGDGVGAEAELEHVRVSKALLPNTHHLLAHAYLLQGRPELAIEEAVKAPPQHAAYAARIRGRAYLAIGDNARTAGAFNEALAAAPDDAELWTDIARFRRSTGEFAGAIEAADRAVTLDPRRVEALTLRGELTRNQYGLTAAIPWFDRALDIEPDHVPALVERASTLGDVGRMKDMLADTRRILSITPNQATAFYLQSMLAARAGKFDLARTLYQRTGGALDKEPAGMLLASAIDLETGNPARAVERLETLVAEQPDNIKARRLLAASQWRLGNAKATLATLMPLASRADADTYALTLIGRAYTKLGDTNSAALYLARAAQPGNRQAAAPLGPRVSYEQLAGLRENAAARPGEAGPQVQLIRALLGRGLGEEALAQARSLQASNPGAPDAHLLVGDALGMLGDYSAAAQEYRRAANIAFTEPVALRLVEALRNAGDRRGAAQILALFLQQNPQNAPAMFIAANNFLQARQWDPAIALYERLRSRLGNRDATLLNNLAWAYSQKGDYDRALPLAARAWELDRNNPATADTYGWLLFKSGEDRVRGLALLKQAARGAPSDIQIRQRLAAAGARGA
jgi:tetratricopeptide (TPR) repeat protein